MKRRIFSAQMFGLSAALWGSVPMTSRAQAQDGPEAGKHYTVINPPAPVSAQGKVEVVEFFWYGCNHCHAFEPILEAWVKKLPDDVAFRRIPVAFRPEPFGTHQKLFYTLESMDLVDKIHRKVFDEIHLNRSPNGQPARLASAEQVGEFVEKNGVDKAQFMAVFNSFAINTKASQAKKLTDAYRIDGVPSLGIHGRYLTGGVQAGDMNRALAITDFLIQKVREQTPPAKG